jgi:hypothetical protein
MKPTKTYKMSSLTKMMLASTSFRNVEDRNAWKRAMIDAELCAAVVPKREPRKQGSGNFTTHSSGTVSSGS